MISREEAMKLIMDNMHSKNLIKHVLATEAVMKALAKDLGQDEEVWAMAGLLHDLDYEFTKDNFEEHGNKTVQMLENKDLPEDIKDAILAHCEKKERGKLIEKAIYAADPVTGFIVAAVLIRKGSKLSDIDVDFLLNRYKEKSFARGANRDQMASCAGIGMTLEDFLSLSLKAMQEISEDLGL
ncbi:MAG: HDIG domain-containing protein [Mesotoga sp.]|jgi:putative nucleotidyltransferase with HDIG domain|uniref:HDIG domain-containing metalloprotein n=1 Tax=unclassified Mesotoga TaxID=1184398 RepID=UPI000EF1B570|nr:MULTISPECIES: HDIG domain-containing metalloprotein [unclassified Mesotoga]MDI9369016.1 HDIG domain-containing protein [Thermotogota bacterium]MDD2333108.1 HDIG domain-containing protein [Mesotoga sp.]MDD3680174.1 HDIG domain-containing protein [Mesotoga sp.]MDD4824660.1 HDIG domain-containing protein [Mesotoga sp.]RLL87416.1 phosphohydrolase [Mesotoga sp. BH458_6_3_2_1]